MFGLGAGEILVIGVIALIFIGPKKLPELARGLGKGIREFQKAKDDLMTEVKQEDQQGGQIKMDGPDPADQQVKPSKDSPESSRASVVDVDASKESPNSESKQDSNSKDS